MLCCIKWSDYPPPTAPVKTQTMLVVVHLLTTVCTCWLVGWCFGEQLLIVTEGVSLATLLYHYKLLTCTCACQTCTYAGVMTLAAWLLASESTLCWTARGKKWRCLVSWCVWGDEWEDGRRKRERMTQATDVSSSRCSTFLTADSPQFKSWVLPN